MIANEKIFLRKLCNDIGIDPGFYDEYNFKAQHKTIKSEVLY